ncbi:Uncharacterised protein at_DN0185 [Pycnogonum litorale]
MAQSHSGSQWHNLPGEIQTNSLLRYKIFAITSCKIFISSALLASPSPSIALIGIGRPRSWSLESCQENHVFSLSSQVFFVAKLYPNSPAFILRTVRLWNNLETSWFPGSYNLSTKSTNLTLLGLRISLRSFSVASAQPKLNFYLESNPDHSICCQTFLSAVSSRG